MYYLTSTVVLISTANPAPLFEQIADTVRTAVAAGIYCPGDPIPSIRAQATKRLINPNTIKRAYEALEREGLIESRQGLGMFVSAKAPELARARVEQAIKATFVQGVRLGNAAQLVRARVDEVYKRAWADTHDSDGSTR